MMCKGKRALVTGAAGGGMGRSIALTLAREGARVVVNYLTGKERADAIEQCAHGPAWINRVNVSPQDIAEGVAFLCCEAAQYITGGELPYRFHS